MIFDIIFFSVLLVSALLAMARGFTRESFSLAAWIGAGVIAYRIRGLGAPYVEDLLGSFDDGAIMAEVMFGVLAFFVLLFLFLMIASAVSARVLSSRIGTVDRSLGLAFGLLRGVVIAALFYLTASKLQQGSMIEPFGQDSFSIGFVAMVSDLIDQWIG